MCSRMRRSRAVVDADVAFDGFAIILLQYAHGTTVCVLYAGGSGTSTSTREMDQGLGFRDEAAGSAMSNADAVSEIMCGEVPELNPNYIALVPYVIRIIVRMVYRVRNTARLLYGTMTGVRRISLSGPRTAQRPPLTLRGLGERSRASSGG